ncbi:hypothetical protein BDZ45DRAFT_136231 [Acephala macrosclerotiorum]|nr:hypothetical protein BDZ45DRAFT_136231 [Acephala macrosclerotiorum]
MLTYKTVTYDVKCYERTGFRASWIAPAQVPLVYLLSSKASVVACLIGSSYERLNWLHRWVSITLLVTMTIHGGFFMREWIKADFLAAELKVMTMLKNGIRAWTVLIWIFLSSLSPLRSAAYEFFILQHITCATAMGIDRIIEIAITEGGRNDECLLADEDEEKLLQYCEEDDGEEMEWSDPGSRSYLTATSFHEDTAKVEEDQDNEHAALDSAEGSSPPSRGFIQSGGRPSITEYIRSSIEYQTNEVMVVVCGGRSLVTKVRNCVAGLSWARIGSGAQGIHLYTEEYSL